MTMNAMLAYLLSRGSSHITSTNPATPPEIKFNYLQHPLDMEILARHVIQIGDMLNLPSISIRLKVNGSTLPVGYPREGRDVEDVEKYLRQFSATT